MLTFQDFEQAPDVIEFVKKAIVQYRSSPMYNTAVLADEYERQQNRTIMQYTKYLYSVTGQQRVDTFSANNRIASNLYHRLNTQRCSYLLGNGVSFAGETKKERLGKDFDTVVYQAGYYALIHGIAYGFWNHDRLYAFPATEVCPLWDEHDGRLRAAIRFWSIDWATKPVTVELYEEDGYTVFRTRDGSKGMDLVEYMPKRAYIQQVRASVADGEEIVGQSNYGSLPVVPLWGSKHKQSTIVGMQASLDSYDLIKSGYANDLQDCAQIYWLIGGNFGMEADETQRFLDRLKLQHVANVDIENSSVTPYTQDIPTAARETYLEMIRKSIYDDFGALDVASISAASKTATEIQAAYQPMDEEADDFEYQLTTFLRQILALNGIDDMPVFKRNRVSNQTEQTQMVMLAAQYLDPETVLTKLPFVTVDEVPKILAAQDEQSYQRFGEAEEEA